MLKQGLTQKLSQKLSPQQIQLVKLLEIPTDEFEKRIKEELEANPSLEGDLDYSASNDQDDNYSSSDNDDNTHEESATSEDVDLQKTEEVIDLSDYLNSEDEGYRTYSGNYGGDDERTETPLSQTETFLDHLHTQLSLKELPEKIVTIASTIIGNIDDDGYFKRELDAIADDLAFGQGLECSEEEVQKALHIVQEFDPAGVAARSLQECLLLQLKRYNVQEPAIAFAIQILEDFYEEFTKKHYEKIQRRLNIDDDMLRLAIDEILHLNPKPGNAFNTGSKNYRSIIPDFILSIEEGEMHLALNAKNAPQLRISPYYARMFDDYSKTRSNKEAVQFIKQKIDSARWFIDAVKQRQDTLMAVMQAILEYQYEYFREGDETKLRPMVLQNISDRVNLDISTVSRVTQDKYIDTPYGIKPIKSFFSESLSTDSGEEVSTREVKKILSDLIGAENKRKPLTDDKLAEILQEKGYNIARRTVAKYREQLDIAVARLRKEL